MYNFTPIALPPIPAGPLEAVLVSIGGHLALAVLGALLVLEVGWLLKSALGRQRCRSQPALHRATPELDAPRRAA